MNQIFKLSNIVFDNSETGSMTLPFEALGYDQLFKDVEIGAALTISDRIDSPVVLESLARAQMAKVRADTTFFRGVAFAVLVKPSVPQNLISFEDTHEGEAFKAAVLDQFSRSRHSGCRGKRVAFLALADNALNSVDNGFVEYRGFFSTAVFYNDQRVTLGFPRANELDAYMSGVYYYLKKQFPALSFEFCFEPFAKAEWCGVADNESIMNPTTKQTTPGRVGSIA